MQWDVYIYARKGFDCTSNHLWTTTPYIYWLHIENSISDKTCCGTLDCKSFLGHDRPLRGTLPRRNLRMRWISTPAFTAPSLATRRYPRAHILTSSIILAQISNFQNNHPRNEKVQYLIASHLTLWSCASVPIASSRPPRRCSPTSRV